jgi:Bacterial PH domain
MTVKPMTRSRWVVGGAGVLLLICGVLRSIGAPKITLLNAALRIDRPPLQGMAWLAAAAGAALLAAAATRSWLRLAALLIAGAALLFACQSFRYRIEADAAALSARGLASTTRIPWSQVQHVEQGAQGLVVWGPGEAQIRLETGSFTPEQRAMLERTVARRLKEGKPPQPAATAN